jgi:hypothetical protein
LGGGAPAASSRVADDSKPVFSDALFDVASAEDALLRPRGSLPATAAPHATASQ